MSKKLFVGCRVRILWSYGWPELAGQVGSITSTSHYVDGPEAGQPCWIVTPDCWGGEIAPRRGRVHGGGRLGCTNDQIEPVIPPQEASELSYTELMDRLKAGEVAA